MIDSLAKPKVNVILYQPGLAGHLMKCLFSLSTNTVRLTALRAGEQDTAASRAETLSFNKTRLYSNWFTFHMHSDGSSEKQLSKTKVMPGQTLIMAEHPIMAEYRFEQWEALYNYCDITYFLAYLSDAAWSSYWLVRSKERMGNFPTITAADIDAEKKLLARLPQYPRIISVDAFLNEDTWEAEYSRVNKIMGLPDTPESTQLYEEWYALRVQEVRTDFNDTSDEQLMKYSHERIKHDTFGQTRFWPGADQVFMSGEFSFFDK